MKLLRKDQKVKIRRKSRKNRIRIVIEHVNRRLKIFKILSYRYSYRQRRFGLRINLIAGIYDARPEGSPLGKLYAERYPLGVL